MREIKVAHSDHNTSRLRVFDAKGSRARLLWLAAMGTPARQYDQFGEALRSQGISCALMDWRGIGSSSVRVQRGTNFGYDQLMSDISESIAALKDHASEDMLLLGGHSLGGQLALLASLRHPCNGLVLCGTGLPYWKSFGGLTGSALLTSTLFINGLGKLFGRFPGRALRFAGNEAPGVMADWTQTVRSGEYRLEGKRVDDRLASLRTPLLGIRLNNDRLVPKPSFDALLDKMPAARASRHRLDSTDFKRQKASHFGWMREPAPVVRVIANWWQEQLHLQNVA